MTKIKKITIVLLTLLLVFALTEGMVFADEIRQPDQSDNCISEEQVTASDDDSAGDNDERLMDYLEIALSTSSEPMNSVLGKQKLSGINEHAYNQLKASAEKVARGEETSTVFTYNADDLGIGGRYTAADLGVAAIADEWYVTDEAYMALMDMFYELNLNHIMNALLVDCPADLYWYEKTAGCMYSMSPGIDYEYDPSLGEYVIFFSDTTTVTFWLTVAEDYSINHESGTYVVDSGIMDKINAVIDTVNGIVEKYKNETDYQKLLHYMKEICNSVSYNTDAASGYYTYQYGNPWQLIWVFDGDPNTNVVCEGYAKAFQFLCDSSSFHSSKVASRLVTGYMGGGGHMWNVVTMDDGHNYLVDVTNCDEGTSGEPDQLFLTGTEDEITDWGWGYIFYTTYVGIPYIYDQETTDLYDKDELEIWNKSYVEGSVPVCEHEWGDWKITKEATCAEEGSRERVCGKCGEIAAEAIPKLNHTPETIPGKKATCTEDGLTDGSRCSVCGEILKEQELIVRRHEFGDWEVITQATRTKNGEKERTCKVCGETEHSVIPAEGNLFNDVKDSTAWFYDTVYNIADTKNQNGTSLMSGYKDGSGNFGPADPLTRQDFAVILYRLDEEPDDVKAKDPFPDADKKGYYFNSICWAKNRSIITGYQDGRFGVGDNITREQVATILFRYAKDYLMIDISEAKNAGSLEKFHDYKAVSPFAVDALTWANGAGIITGKSNGTIDPQGNAARAEIGAMVLRFMKYLDAAEQ